MRLSLPESPGMGQFPVQDQTLSPTGTGVSTGGKGNSHST